MNELQKMENTNPGPLDENHANNVGQSSFEAPGTSSKRQLDDDDDNMPSSSKKFKSSKASWIYKESKNVVPFNIFDLANTLPFRLPIQRNALCDRRMNIFEAIEDNDFNYRRLYTPSIDDNS
ncbi:uncharacterized protein LOC119682681 [Teleopsis dalmanni]|uniref:uncharacterized protein LOC119682681 n=1 Tax=Teleopsis dalmanni TaxID=139649 RepID=UPI0018CD36F5|nr:uncharacterized protein LOC119682681 [Teleopsis dalmanni]